METSNIIETVVLPWGIKIALAIAIFYIGRIVVATVVKMVEKFMSARDMDEILVKFLSSILRWVLLLFVVIAALSQLGIDTTSLVALLGAAGLAIGLSLQSSLANFAAFSSSPFLSLATSASLSSDFFLAFSISFFSTTLVMALV